MSEREEVIFEVTDRWGEKIVLTKEDWERIVSKRPGVEGYEEQLKQTLESPNMVFEGRYVDSKVFYKKDLLDDDPLYRGCYVVAVIRYREGADASIRTLYFSTNVQAKLGKVLHAER